MPRLISDVAIVGAGIYGASTAYFLRRSGVRVMLLDAWGVAHPRATSAGESRIIRAGYGPQSLYTRWAWESLRQWKAWQREWKEQIFFNTGVLWLAEEESQYVRDSLSAMQASRVPVEQLGAAELRRRYPQFAPLETRLGYFEPRAGVLMARKATRLVAEAFVRDGGKLVVDAVAPPPHRGGTLDSVRLASGATLAAAVFVFACGPWLPRLFPALLAQRIRVSKQEVFFFGPPAARREFDGDRLPAWVEIGAERFGYYGVPALDGRGLKIASDHSGPAFDPTSGDRTVSAEGIAAARDYLGRRLPGMASAPLVETRVCQYERTADANLILDRHPELNNVWIAGGGSGHGFKLGPAAGRALAARVIDGRRCQLPEEVTTLSGPCD